MTTSEPQLTTPVYIKDEVEAAWPDDPVFYVLGANGLSLGRNHPMFRSCVPVEHGPAELAEQEHFLEPSYPELPQKLFEQLVGFFACMAEQERCEAGAYLIFNRETEEVSARVPNQVSTVSKSYDGTRWPIGMEYDNLEPLPPEEMIFGTIHSHVYSSAYSSGIDKHDETDKPGVHLVVGRLDQDPPDFHVEAVIDGERFELSIDQVIENYEKPRDTFPEEWIDQVKVKVWQWSSAGAQDTSGYSGGWK